jgi:hypothetical protein
LKNLSHNVNFVKRQLIFYKNEIQAERLDHRCVALLALAFFVYYSFAFREGNEPDASTPSEHPIEPSSMRNKRATSSSSEGEDRLLSRGNFARQNLQNRIKELQDIKDPTENQKEELNRLLDQQAKM